MPASLLPFKDQWQEMANSKTGEPVLIVLPKLENGPQSALKRVAAHLREKGHAVTMLSAEWFEKPIEEVSPSSSTQS